MKKSKPFEKKSSNQLGTQAPGESDRERHARSSKILAEKLAKKKTDSWKKKASVKRAEHQIEERFARQPKVRPLGSVIIRPVGLFQGRPKSGPPIKSSHRPSSKRPRTEEKGRKDHDASEPVRLKATVDKNRKGFSFLIFENRSYEDAFVPPDESERLFHGDRVEVLIRPPGKVLQVNVLDRRVKEVVGRYSPHPNGAKYGGWVAYEKKKARQDIYIPEVPREPGKAPREQDWVRVKLETHSSGPHPITGVLLEVFGQDLPPSADISMIAAEYNLTEKHSDAAVQEAQSKKLEVPGKDLIGRVDLRNVPLITIDGITARDFDDAVYVERNSEGHILWVAIADVSHYVQEGSHLDQEARSRGTSVYFPERAFHMLPAALSENLCSLRPKEPRLAMVAKMEFSSEGKRIKTEVMEAVIESKRRATYEEIQSELEKEMLNSAWEFAPHFELYRALRKMRTQRGSIDFEFPEAELKVKPTGEVDSITIRPRLDAHRLIEEFMIAANEAVTVWMLEKNWPFVYRIHEEPSLKATENFQALAATVGMNVSFEKSRSPKVFAVIVRKLEGHPAQTLLNMSLLRSMKQAIYSSTHGIHFGLASDAYTHFTSPIRRYPDLVVHRLLRLALKAQDQELTQSSRDQLEKELAEICEHCSYRERLASDAERDSIKLKQVRVMMSHLGDEYPGKVVGMAAAGLFIQISEPYVEGLIPVDSMDDDYYEFQEDKMVFLGRRHRKAFRIGDSISVRVVRADLDRRQIDFSMVEEIHEAH